MTNSGNEISRNPGSRLHVLNLLIALVAGLISIVGGLYSLKNNYLTPKTGSLWGVVRDENIAKPLWLAPVEITEISGTEVIATVNTDQSGKYTVDGLREGDYTVTVSAPRHKTQTKMVKIYAKSNAAVNFDLIPKDSGAEVPLSETQPSVPVTAKSYYPAQPQAPPPTPYANSSETPPVTGRRGRHRRASSGGDSAGSSPYVGTEPYSSSGGYQGNSSSAGPYDNNAYGGSQPPASSQNSLMQTVGQLIQGYVAKKAGSQTVT